MQSRRLWMRFGRLTSIVGLLVSGAAHAQSTSESPLAPPPNGMTKREPSVHVLQGATVHVAPGEVLEGATIVLRDGLIASVGDLAGTPPGARVHDLSGMHIYAGFIESFIEADAPDPDADRPGAHWNGEVTPDRHVLDGSGLSSGDRTALRKLGFTVAHIAPEDGVFRGSSAVVTLAEPEDSQSDQDFGVIDPGPGFQIVAFETGGFASNSRDPNSGYPSSHMGAVALIRQTLIDAQSDLAMEGGTCLTPLTDEPVYLFDIDHELKAFSASEIISEFDLKAGLIGTGTEYKLLDAFAQLDMPMVLPLVFPKAPDVSSVGKADSVELETLMSWEQAPTNARRLSEAGVTFALTSSKNPSGLGGRGAFLKNLRTSVEHGLSEDDALAAITTVPAIMLGIDTEFGRVATDFRANLVVMDSAMFDEDAQIMTVWIDGKPHVINEQKVKGADGAWKLDLVEMDTGIATLTIDASKRKVTFEPPTPPDGEPETWKGSKLDVTEDAAGLRVNLVLEREAEADEPGEIGIVTAMIDGDEMTGFVNVQGMNLAFVGSRDPESDEESSDDDGDEDFEAAPEDLGGFPFGPYAMRENPAAQSAVFTGATVWTSSDAGVIEDGIVFINDGRIAWVGDREGWQDFLARVRLAEMPVEYDLTGKHLTAGIIDAHSHTGLFSFGVNEATQASTAEVRIADAVDPSHINWYRQLAAGVTTVMSLHGSANPIGGQSQIHKVRWGSQTPREMRMEGAKLGIKFALGENVKQSNWGDDNRFRYPQTRMGVETFIRDRFHAAEHYASQESPPRDLELEALAEILSGERLIHCHSYRQDEILMLCRVAEDFGFKIGTFQHGLEVYKVAEVVQEHAIGASLFSDWWAFKVEVQDAIPHAGPLQAEAGVLTSYNSDSDELVRHMHTEAAKAAKYSQDKISDELAWNFVTINPAIQLGINERVGSIEIGKDADLAVWSGHPLSTLSRCEQTWIDGAQYFSLEMDAEHRARIMGERGRLINKLLASKKPSSIEEDESESGTEGTEGPADPEYAAIRASVRERFLEALNMGSDPLHATCGLCGVSDWHSLVIEHNHAHHGHDHEHE